SSWRVETTMNTPLFIPCNTWTRGEGEWEKKEMITLLWILLFATMEVFKHKVDVH
uniref:Uncharacterized protein n=1 Tax=Chlorocebus sabaeus TaxID=60711 RepID=A0A0D9S1M3_CHLSB